MAKLTPDATRTEHGLVINEKIIRGARFGPGLRRVQEGAQYKADRLLSGGTGKVKGVTIHNTNDLKNVEEDAEQYTRATWPNANMNDARVHYYVDDINAWQNLREDEVGWHAGDGRKATGGNETTLSIEIIMDGSGSKEDLKAEENGVLLAALLLKKHGERERAVHAQPLDGPPGLHRAGREEELPAVHPAPLGAVQAEGRRKAHGAERRRDHHGGGQDGDHGQGQGERAADGAVRPIQERGAAAPGVLAGAAGAVLPRRGRGRGVAATSPLRRASTRRAFSSTAASCSPRRTTMRALGR
ncbi:MAG: N-acetylmuramoyl-L-alanine amidase [Oscillospiraceae bacterium]